MHQDNYGIQGGRYTTSINDRSPVEEAPYRRYTEGSTFRDKVRIRTDVIRANSTVDLSPKGRQRHSFSDDFQDSIAFSYPPQRTMSYTGGTNSLPAFLSTSSHRAHSALHQQMQTNQRAVDNDYSEHPQLCVAAPVVVETRATTRSTRTSNGRSRRHRHAHRETSGRRTEHDFSGRSCNSREEGAHPAFRNAFSATSSERIGRQSHTDFNVPPPRPPLSKYHFEHRGPGRALRISSSLPTSLAFNAGDSILVPMCNNPAPSRHNRREKNRRHRTTETIGHTAPRSRRGYSLTPPPVCRTNKPRYDDHNRLIQTVSSPSVVTHCVDSSSNSCRLQGHPVSSTPKISQPTSKKGDSSNQENSKLFQPTHVVLSQPKRQFKKKLEEEDDEIAQQKKGLVVSLNNNITKCPHSVVTVHTKDGTTTMSSVSSKMSDDSTLKKDENAPMLQNDDHTSQAENCLLDSEEDQSHSHGQTKPGEHNHTCKRCGKCTCSQCQEQIHPPSRSERRPSSPHCWMCNHRCLCDVDSCVETATCLCCVRGLFYHCSDSDEDTGVDKPCSCHSEKSCMRWTLMGLLSLCLPCLCFYPLARGCVKLCRKCSGDKTPACRCTETYR